MTWWYFDLVHTERIHSVDLAKQPTRLRLGSLNIGLSTSRSCTAKAPIWWLWGPPWRPRYVPPKWSNQVPRIQVTRKTMHMTLLDHHAHHFCSPCLFVPFHTFPVSSCLSDSMSFRTELQQKWIGACNAGKTAMSMRSLMSGIFSSVNTNWLILIELQNGHSQKDLQRGVFCNVPHLAGQAQWANLSCRKTIRSNSIVWNVCFSRRESSDLQCMTITAQ